TGILFLPSAGAGGSDGLAAENAVVCTDRYRSADVAEPGHVVHAAGAADHRTGASAAGLLSRRGGCRARGETVAPASPIDVGRGVPRRCPRRLAELLAGRMHAA